MAVNLAEKYSENIAEAFAGGSLLAGKASNRYDFSGVATLKIYTPVTVPLVNYSRTASANRYGTPAEMQDTVQELVLAKDESFALVIDKGNRLDQANTKEAGHMLGMQIRERVSPAVDRHALGEWIKNAGTICAESAALTKANIVERVGAGMAVLDEALVPLEGRYLGVTPAVYNLIRLSSEFCGLEALGRRSVEKGVVGELFGASVVKIPASLFPNANVNFLIWFKGSVIQPQKIRDARVHVDPPGYSGNLLEGRWVYDAFVLGAKAAGVYASVAAGTQQATPTVSYTGGSTDTITIASSGADTIKYTLDGSDPRYSTSAKTYSAAISTAAWPAGNYTVKAVAYDAEKFTSNVATQICVCA